MGENEREEIWKDIKDTWNMQSESENINIQVSELVDEFRSKIGQFEKDLISKDLALINSSLSEFEKESIKSDLNLFSKVIKKAISKFRKRK